MSTGPEQALHERIFAVVEQVPAGVVATYGDIALIVGTDARTVGYALNEIPKHREGSVPWQRIINSQGGISTRGFRQREHLEAEGIVFDDRGRVPLARYRWSGPAAAWARDHGFKQLPSRSEPVEPENSGGQLTLF